MLSRNWNFFFTWTLVYQTALGPVAFAADSSESPPDPGTPAYEIKLKVIEQLPTNLEDFNKLVEEGIDPELETPKADAQVAPAAETTPPTKPEEKKPEPVPPAATVDELQKQIEAQLNPSAENAALGRAALEEARKKIVEAQSDPSKAATALEEALKKIVEAQVSPGFAKVAIEEARKKIVEAQLNPNAEKAALLKATLEEARKKIVEAQNNPNNTAPALEEALEKIVEAQGDPGLAKDAIEEARKKIVEAQDNPNNAKAAIEEARKKIVEAQRIPNDAEAAIEEARKKIVEAQLIPNNAKAAIAEARKKIAEARKTKTDKRKEEQGIAPTGDLENENQELRRSHLSFLTEMVTQSRYSTPLLIEMGIDGVAVLTYWYYCRKMKEYWIPRLKAMEDLKTALADVNAAVEAAETGFKYSLMKQWKNLLPQEAMRKSLDPVLREKIVGGLSQLNAGTLSAAEKELLENAQSVDDAFRELTGAMNRWIDAVRDNLKPIEDANNKVFLAQGTKGAARAINMRAIFDKEIRAMEALDRALARPSLLSYYLRARNLKDTWLDQLTDFRNLANSKSDTIPPAAKARAARVNSAVSRYIEAETRCRYSFAKNWDTLTYSQRSLYASNLDPARQAELLKELEALVAGEGLVGKEKLLIGNAENLDDAIKALTEALEDLKRVVKTEIPDAQLLKAAGFGTKSARYIENTRKAVLNEVRALQQFHAKILKTQGATATQAQFRKILVSAEETMEALRVEAAISAGVKRPKFWTMRAWGPRIGYTAMVVIPVILYAMQRSAVARERANIEIGQKRKMLGEDEGQLNALLNLPSLRMQYGAFYRAWMQHPQLGGNNIPCPLQPPGPPEALNPDLVHSFLNYMTLSTMELNQELDNDNYGVPKEVANLTQDERLYRKIWSKIFADAMTATGTSSRIKAFRPETKEDPHSVSDRKPNEGPAKSVGDLVEDLGNAVAHMPQNLPTKEKAPKYRRYGFEEYGDDEEEEEDLGEEKKDGAAKKGENGEVLKPGSLPADAVPGTTLKEGQVGPVLAPAPMPMPPAQGPATEPMPMPTVPPMGPPLETTEEDPAAPPPGEEMESDEDLEEETEAAVEPPPPANPPVDPDLAPGSEG